MLSESKDAADAPTLGDHLGNMLIIHITIPNAFLCKTDFESQDTSNCLKVVAILVYAN